MPRSQMHSQWNMTTETVFNNELVFFSAKMQTICQVEFRGLRPCAESLAGSLAPLWPSLPLKCTLPGYEVPRRGESKARRSRKCLPSSLSTC